MRLKRTGDPDRHPQAPGTPRPANSPLLQWRNPVNKAEER